MDKLTQKDFNFFQILNVIVFYLNILNELCKITKI